MHAQGGLVAVFLGLSLGNCPTWDIAGVGMCHSKFTIGVNQPEGGALS